MLTGLKVLSCIFCRSVMKGICWSSERCKVAKIVGFMFKRKYYLRIDVKIVLYNALFYSIWNYCILVWGTTNKSNINQHYILQKEVIRIIANFSYCTHMAGTFFKYELIPINSTCPFRLSLAYKSCVTCNSQFFHFIACLTNKAKLTTPEFNHNITSNFAAQIIVSSG